MQQPAHITTANRVSEARMFPVQTAQDITSQKPCCISLKYGKNIVQKRLSQRKCEAFKGLFCLDACICDAEF